MARTPRAVKSMPFDTERELAGADCTSLAGIDEVGRGPWAGPVVAAAVMFDGDNAPAGLDDSKRLSEAKRERLHDAIRATANVKVGLGIIPVETIDTVNILQATFLAMRQALDALGLAPHTVLVDGKLCPPLLPRTIPVIGGDGKCPSIAAASIIAKVTRDRIMIELAERFPGYGWAANKGYGTREHIEGIAKLGITPHHRRSFAPIRAVLADIEGTS